MHHTRWHLGLILALMACHPPSPVTIPRSLPPASPEKVAGWVTATIPPTHILYRFRWQFTQENGEVIGGAGAARLAPPDSVRLDFAGPLGTHRTAAVVIGDTLRWIVPAHQVDGWRPTVSLAWSVLGISRPPRDWVCPAGSEGPSTSVWQCLRATDTVEVEQRSGFGRTALTRWWSKGRQVGEIQTWHNPDGTVARSVVLLRHPLTRLEVTMKSAEALLTVPDEVWDPPASQ